MDGGVIHTYIGIYCSCSEWNVTDLQVYVHTALPTTRTCMDWEEITGMVIVVVNAAQAGYTHYY